VGKAIEAGIDAYETKAAGLPKADEEDRGLLLNSASRRMQHPRSVNLVTEV